MIGSVGSVHPGFLTLLLTNLAKCKLVPLPPKFTASPVDLKFAKRCELCAQRLLKENNGHKDLIYLQSQPTYFYEYFYRKETSFSPKLSHRQAKIVQESEYT